MITGRELTMTEAIPNSASAAPNAMKPARPPHPLDGEWYLHVNGEVYGPYSGHELSEFAKEGRVNGASEIQSVGQDKWVRIAEEPRLAAIVRPAKAAPPPAAISAGAGSTVVNVTNQVNPHPVMFLDDGEAFGPKSPGVALLLSLLLCGAGQMYCGKVGKGILMLIGCVFLWLVFLGWIISIWSMVDAYHTAKQMNLKYRLRLQALAPP
jgi:TM2 domain-containing membrane protein YozV